MEYNNEFYDGFEKHNEHFIDGLYKSFLPKVESWVQKNNGSLEDAADVFQEGLLVIFNSISKGKFNPPKSFEAFLFRICQNKWIDTLRRRGRDRDIKDQLEKHPDEDENLVKKIEEAEEEMIRQERFNQAFDLLSDRCKKIITYTIDGYNISEIAELIGVTKNALSVAKNRCIESMRKKI